MVILKETKKETYQSIQKACWGHPLQISRRFARIIHPVIQGVIKTLLMTRSWSGRQVGIGS